MKHVLDVGQCGLDHGSIRHLIEGRFDARVSQAHDLPSVLAELDSGKYDLVLVNRLLDGDGSSGLEIVRAVRAEPRWAQVRVMLVSNYPQAQAEAVAAGAEPGFGKSALHAAGTLERLAAWLE